MANGWRMIDRCPGAFVIFLCTWECLCVQGVIEWGQMKRWASLVSFHFSLFRIWRWMTCKWMVHYYFGLLTTFCLVSDTNLCKSQGVLLDWKGKKRTILELESQFILKFCDRTLGKLTSCAWMEKREGGLPAYCLLSLTARKSVVVKDSCLPSLGHLFFMLYSWGLVVTQADSCSTILVWWHQHQPCRM